MIKNLWKNIYLYCGCHEGKPVPLIVHDGAANTRSGDDILSSFYSCPKYDPANRAFGEVKCFNRLTFNDAEELVEHLSDVIEAANAEGISVNLEGYGWTAKNGIEYYVFKHSKTGIHVKAINRRILKRGS